VARPPRGLEALLVDALRRSGAREVMDEGPARPDRVGALFVGTDTPGFREGVEAQLVSALPGVPLAPRWHPFDGVRWLAERGETSVPLAGHPPLRILPGVAFGNGEHPTTLRCLRVLARRVAYGDRIADVGSGSGILAVAAARLGAAVVLAVELDPEGCRETRANAARNGVGDLVRVVRHRATPDDPGPLVGAGGGAGKGDTDADAAAPWDGIAANLEAEVLVPLLPALASLVRPGGWVLASGVIEPERERVASAARELRTAEAHEDDGWWTLVLERADG
jgi:ribosomal protein L11 methylase PrmA